VRASSTCRSTDIPPFGFASRPSIATRDRRFLILQATGWTWRGGLLSGRRSATCRHDPGRAARIHSARIHTMMTGGAELFSSSPAGDRSPCRRKLHRAANSRQLIMRASLTKDKILDFLITALQLHPISANWMNGRGGGPAAIFFPARGVSQHLGWARERCSAAQKKSAEGFRKRLHARANKHYDRCSISSNPGFWAFMQDNGLTLTRSRARRAQSRRPLRIARTSAAPEYEGRAPPPPQQPPRRAALRVLSHIDSDPARRAAEDAAT